MKTVILDPLPVEVERLIERRRALGLDLYDEVWERGYTTCRQPPDPGGCGRRDPIPQGREL